jgi:chromosome segregation ATPase
LHKTFRIFIFLLLDGSNDKGETKGVIPVSDKFDQMMGKLDQMNGDVQGLKKDIGDMNGDIQGLKKDIGEMKGDIQGLKKITEDIPSIKQAVFETAGEMNDVKTMLKSLVKSQERQDRILEALSTRSLEQETELKELKRIK